MFPKAFQTRSASRLIAVSVLAFGMWSSSLPARAQDAADLLVRLSRMEGQMRQLSGQVEKLQYENQRLSDQLQRFQKDVDLRFQDQGGAKPSSRPAPGPGPTTPTNPQRRGDAFDPEANPDAPGAPRQIGSVAPSAPLSSTGSLAVGQSPRALPPSQEHGGYSSQPSYQQPPYQPEVTSRQPGRIESMMDDGEEEDGPITPGLPGRRPANPLDLSGSGSVAVIDPSESGAAPHGRSAPSPAVTQTGNAKGDYDLAYGYILRNEYQAAEMAFRQFIQAHPRNRLVPDATYWLGESYYLRGMYREAAEQYLAVTTTYPQSTKAPYSMLKLGMSLNAIGAREQACSTYREIDRKFPNAGANVKRDAERETKRARCAAA